MSYFLAILFIAAASVLFFLYVIIKKYSIKKALYYIISIVGTIMILLFLSNIYDFIFKNHFSTLLLIIPFALIIIYCEKFFIKEVKPATALQPISTQRPEPILQSEPETKPRIMTKQEVDALYESVPRTEIVKVIDELMVRTARQVIRIKTENAENLPITASKFGGLPYIPKDGNAPADKEGRQLRLLAQLNMSELPSNNFMPEEGILQFWALNNNMVGLEAYHLTTKGTSRVVYFEKIDTNVTTEDVQHKYNPWYEDGHEDCFPILNEFALKFTLGEEGMGTEDFRWNKLFSELWNEKYPDIEVSELGELPNAPDDSDYSADFSHKIGGYPTFVQGDFRGNTKENESLMLLLQITSTGKRGERRILWGDFGMCNFFIKTEDLAKLDFSNVIYHWDCS